MARRPAGPGDLVGTWTHAPEAGGPAERQVWVRGGPDAAAGPSRGRRGLRLEADGTLRATGPGPTDRPSSVGGRWRLAREDVLRLEPAIGSAGSWRIEEIGEDRMVLVRLTEAEEGEER